MLHHERVRAQGGLPERAFLFLHGILGSGGNLRSLARKLVEAEPTWEAVLVDLRGHGKSPVGPPPHTLEACADDVAELAASLALPFRGVLGHSFGGKVAMVLAGRPALGLTHAVFVDSMPGARPGGRGSESTLEVLETLAALPRTFSTRDAFVDQLVARGQPRTTAMWLAMSLRRGEGGLELAYDLSAIGALLDDYFARDLWPLLEGAHAGTARAERTHLHVVIGDRSTVFAPEDRARVEALAREGLLRLDVLPAGHWVHVDDADGLARALVASAATQERRGEAAGAREDRA
jgi:pimeloyl-ACP methyl ester carboxylesterase